MCNTLAVYFETSYKYAQYIHLPSTLHVRVNCCVHFHSLPFTSIHFLLVTVLHNSIQYSVRTELTSVNIINFPIFQFSYFCATEAQIKIKINKLKYKKRTLCHTALSFHINKDHDPITDPFPFCLFSSSQVYWLASNRWLRPGFST